MSKHSHFHDHAAEFDRRAAMSDIRGQLAERLIEAMELRGAETVLDVATGTGRFVRPVSHQRRLPLWSHRRREPARRRRLNVATIRSGMAEAPPAGS